MSLSIHAVAEPSPHIPAPGFPDPVQDGQTCFRAILDATARPGSIQVLQDVLKKAPSPLTPPTAAICLTLLDTETSVWLSPQMDSPEVRQFLSFHCASPISRRPEEASFGILSASEASCYMERFHVGTAEYPDRAATLILQSQDISADYGLTLSGPGIKDTHCMHIAGCDADFWQKRDSVNADFPTGLDFIFTDMRRIACIPRTTEVRG
jgi:alpha-D-ribose 1-methylphosphonate 5-triphosphate synthase subunit PhnH